jgi:hypothetical protein
MNLDWIKSIPDYLSYFDQEHQFIIKLIGMDDYLKFYACFNATNFYFSESCLMNRGSHDRDQLISLVGQENYEKLFDYFGKTQICFSSLIKLKKAWLKLNPEVDYYIACRTLNISVKSVYRWRREESEKVLKTNKQKIGDQNG